MSAPLTLTAGTRDLSRFLGGSSFGNTDPGGFETLAGRPDALRGLKPGSRVTVRCGLEVAWDGIINEPSQRDRGDRSEASIAGVGYRSQLQKDPVRQLYIDQDLSRWKGPSVQHRINLIAGGYTGIDPSVIPDASTGAPSLVTQVVGGWTTTSKPHITARYDAQGLPIASMYYAWKKNDNVAFLAVDANWAWDALLGQDDTDTLAFDSSGDLQSAASSGSGTLLATAANRTFARANLLYSTGPVVSDGTDFSVFWTCLAVYGDHGLTKRGTATATQPQGFYPGDIARHAIQDLGTDDLDFDMRLEADATAYITRQATYFTPTTRDQIALDQAAILGWHYGVWEPASILDSTPRAFFTAPPSAATCVVFRRDCDDLQEPSIRADKLYDTALVAYTDAAGTQRYVTTTLANPIAAQAGYDAGTLILDMGIGSAAAASTFGQTALALSQSSARGSGSATLPDFVRVPGGGMKPACLLRAGRDRLRIADLPSIGSILETDTRRYDTFLIRRVETTVDDSGIPRTRVDFDTGADLLEVLVARLGAAVAGVGG